MLDTCQAFKAAFLHRCLEQGHSLEETHALVKESCEALLQGDTVKEAGPWPWIMNNVPGLAAASGIASGTAQALVSQFPAVGLGAYVGIPAAAGGAAGYGLAQLEGLNDEDPDEIKTQEKIEAYRRTAARAALQKQLRAGRDSRRPARPLL